MHETPLCSLLIVIEQLSEREIELFSPCAPSPDRLAAQFIDIFSLSSRRAAEFRSPDTRVYLQTATRIYSPTRASVDAARDGTTLSFRL